MDIESDPHTYICGNSRAVAHSSRHTTGRCKMECSRSKLPHDMCGTGNGYNAALLA